MLAVSMAAVVIAPLLMPGSYSVIEHSVSESAAQGLEGAWLTRSGFLLLGLAVLRLTQAAGNAWGSWGRAAHRLYGVGMLGAAAFSHKPWLDVPFVEFEDVLHSAAANAVGFGFTVGVILVSLRRGQARGGARVFDAVAVVVALGLTMAMFNVSGIAGLVQRIMFGFGYAWYGMEAIHAERSPARIGAA